LLRRHLAGFRHRVLDALYGIEQDRVTEAAQRRLEGGNDLVGRCGREERLLLPVKRLATKRKIKLPPKRRSRGVERLRVGEISPGTHCTIKFRKNRL
jgi:hypothetical protein